MKGPTPKGQSARSKSVQPGIVDEVDLMSMLQQDHADLDDRGLRTELVNAEITLDAIERYPTNPNPREHIFVVWRLRGYIAQLRQRIATLKVFRDIEKQFGG